MPHLVIFGVDLKPFQNVKAVREHLYKPNSIHVNDEAVPKTIRDAIRFVALVKERFVWIDSLCICQDDQENKMEQISNMGNIYSDAVFTLVATYGTTCHAGLPGVTPMSRNRFQGTECVQNMTLAPELPSLDSVIKKSRWEKRGWCYQEKELSRRCIFFGEESVYFRCNRTEFSEDSGLTNLDPRGNASLNKIQGESHPVWDDYSRAVNYITARKLTQEDDILNAFIGVASLLQPAFKCDFLFGLPETELDNSLLWQPTGWTRRRDDSVTQTPIFPSWTWAGWTGKMRYDIPSSNMYQEISRVRWQFTRGDSKETGLCSSNELRAPRRGSHSHWVLGDSLYSGYWWEAANADLWCAHPVIAQRHREVRVLVQPSSHVLSFHAYTARFRVGTTHSTRCHRDKFARCVDGKHIVCPRDILDDDGVVAGRIYVAESMLPTLKEEKHELVCLSRRSESRSTDITDPSHTHIYKNLPERDIVPPITSRDYPEYDVFNSIVYDDKIPWAFYNVMLVRWDCGRAYRVALGKIHITAFLKAETMEKLIRLA
jgi:hypothetical protein